MDHPGGPRFPELVAEALKYWELRRVIYNIVLAAVMIFYFARAWPGSRVFLSVNSVLLLFILTLLANVCYSTAYVVDVFVQMSGLRPVWLQRRWLLFLVGMVFATLITKFFAFALFMETS